VVEGKRRRRERGGVRRRREACVGGEGREKLALAANDEVKILLIDEMIFHFGDIPHLLKRENENENE
jgi:hypothetical protein